MLGVSIPGSCCLYIVIQKGTSGEFSASHSLRRFLAITKSQMQIFRFISQFLFFFDELSLPQRVRTSTASRKAEQLRIAFERCIPLYFSGGHSASYAFLIIQHDDGSRTPVEIRKDDQGFAKQNSS